VTGRWGLLRGQTRRHTAGWAGRVQVLAKLAGAPTGGWRLAGGIGVAMIATLAASAPATSSSAGRSQAQAEATATPPAYCSECDVSATRAAVQATAWGAYLNPTPVADGPVVRAAMFWMAGCPACEEVIRHVLPPLKAEYGSQLDLFLIEVASQEDVSRLYEVAAGYGIPRTRAGVPFVVIGEHALVGPSRVRDELPGLIEHYLAQGGVDLPDLPALAAALPAGTPLAPLPGVGTSPAARPEGFALAVAVLTGTASAVLYALASLRSPRLPVPQGRWADRVWPWLALIGLVVAAYLAYVETQSVEAMCGPVGDCNAVQTSPYARLFGVLPLGVLGVLAYLLILAAWAVESRATGRVAAVAGLTGFGIALFGTIFSLYLTFLEAFIIRAVCLWCLASAVTITLILMLRLEAPRAWRGLQTREGR